MTRGRDAAALAALLLAAACAPGATTAPPAAGGAPAGGGAPAVPSSEPRLRVGIVVDSPSVSVASDAGLEIAESDAGTTLARVPAGATVVFSADGAGRVGFRVGGGPLRPTGAALLTARPAGGGTVSIAGQPYHGSAIVRAAGPGRVTAVNQVALEQYLLGVVPQEIGHVSPERYEAARAQAVAARTYAVKYMGRRADLGFDVYASTQDQVYGGVQAEFDPVSRAVRETAGEILTYDGRPIEAYYHSTCAGRTAAIDEVWNTAPVPYLVSVVDVNPATGEAYDAKSSRFHWTESWSVDSLARILDRTLADSLPAGARSVGEIRDLQVTRRTTSGRVKALRISTTAGDFVVGGDRVRWILLTPEGRPLNSSKFDVEVQRDAAGKPQRVVATGGGWGHGIGMCQVGAMGRAEAGQSYREILAAYFPGTKLVRIY